MMVDKATDTEPEHERTILESNENHHETESLCHNEGENCVQDKFKLAFVVGLFFLALSLVAVASILAWAYVERERNISDKAQLHEPTRLYSSPVDEKILNSSFRPDKPIPDHRADKHPSREDEDQRSSIPDDSNESMHLYRVYDAISKGAVCLDGTPPAYYLRPGKGLGLNRWIIHFNGGAWCFDEKSCLERSRGSLGSTKHLPKAPPVIQGINSPNGQLNPDFYDWNLVWIVYCDGASFTGDRADPVVVGGENIFFRGKRVLDAVITDLLGRGVLNAEGIILTGSSAGSMTAMFAVDSLAEQLPNVPMHVLSDAGYFIETQSIGGKNIGAMFKKVYEMQNSSAGLNRECIRTFGEHMGWKCFLPQHTFKFIKHPVFILNAAYDVWALLYFVGIDCKFPAVAVPNKRKRRDYVGDKTTSDTAQSHPYLNKKNRDISGFEIVPYFRSVKKSATEDTNSSLTEKNTGVKDIKRNNISGGDKERISNQEKRDFEPQIMTTGNLDVYNNLGVFPSQEYMTNSRLEPNNRPEVMESDATGNRLHLNIAPEENNAVGYNMGEPGPLTPTSQVMNGVQAVPSNERQEEMSLNPLASSVSTLNSVADNVHKDKMDKDTIGLLNEVFKKLTKMMPKKHGNLTSAKNGTNAKQKEPGPREQAQKGPGPNELSTKGHGPNEQSPKGLGQNRSPMQKGPGPKGPSLMKKEQDKLSASKPVKEPNAQPKNGLGPPKTPAQHPQVQANHTHKNIMDEVIKQARKIQQAMKPNKHPLQHANQLEKSKSSTDDPKSRNGIQKLLKNKRSTSIVKEYINILRSDPPECTENQMIHVMQYRNAMMQATNVVTNTQSAGLFLVSCIQHSLSLFDETWTGVTVKQKSIQQAFGDWYYGRDTNHYNIDGVYPTNPSCP